ncbi:hypothetical protein DICPUDRAFT_97605 [Dictyostelium purpureum]|uniref:RNI-like protein n=1 Tax=Dictyostelium purpureum TaxID=5786 RepID=F0ZI79_DICPU|nr:uncharacterized protein DICPUDRAFT_97605 [Dictyostelium purpureum]EGC36358.1 hypothetical protein DICPUDRAFT_97605 [Dictyostelium purpureum]|eukprot:XP_003287112.1 hypothetical protein DICPUDRAFT_97605 [Dictyostelium purpureum]
MIETTTPPSPKLLVTDVTSTSVSAPTSNLPPKSIPLASDNFENEGVKGFEYKKYSANTTKKENKSNVRELKRLFESKKSSFNSPLRILPNFKGKKDKSDSALGINDNLLPPPTTTVHKTNTPSTANSNPNLNLDNIISQADRKYYFYVNEAIRKNQPIVPSLAIRRKSIDLTHSPIKGSLYATKYQHSYSPSTRTIQLTKNNVNRNSASLKEGTTTTAVAPASSIPSNSSIHSSLGTEDVDNNDSTWIKPNKARDDDYFTDRNVSPSRLPVSRSTFDLKFNRNGVTKEEPTNIKFNSLTVAQDQKFNHDNSQQSSSSSSSTHQKPPKESKTFKFPFSKGKEKSSSFVFVPPTEQQQQESQEPQPNTAEAIALSLSKKDRKKLQDDKEREKQKQNTALIEEDKPTRLFPWVTLRRIKRSNTADISPIKQPQVAIVKAKIDITHESSVKPQLSTVQVVSKAVLSQQPQVATTEKQQAVLSNDVTISIQQEQKEQKQKNEKDSLELQKKLNRLSIKQQLLEPVNHNGSSEQRQQEIAQVAEQIEEIQQKIEQIQHEEIKQKHQQQLQQQDALNKPKFISLSTTILKRDLQSRASSSSPVSPSTSPHSSFLSGEGSSPPSPKKFVSVAKPTKTKIMSSISDDSGEQSPTLSTDSSISNGSDNGGEQSPNQLSALHPTMSAPSSPTLSPTNKEALIMMEKHKINYSDDGFLLNPNPPSISNSDLADGIISKPINNRLEQLLTSHRNRSASVGSILEQMSKFEIDDIPPLKVHCSSLEECLETFEKPDPQHGRCYVLDLGNCSLGDEGLTTLSDNFPGNLEIADLSWNDIGCEGSDGFDNFCSMLRRSKNLIQSLSLMGNQLNPQMIELLLESIEIRNIEQLKTKQVKKGYKGFGLNLKETGIENEGAEHIAQYIGANKTPSIIGLDLTSSSVTDVAMSEFSVSLSKTQFLTTLILDENYLGDDGAILLADGLKFNKSLTHLQLRNTDIGENGTTELCNACKFNSVLTLLDVSLNPWQLGGEISLQSLNIFKQQLFINSNGPKVKIVWKDDGMESCLEIEEILDIVQYFGTDKIIDIMMMGINFSPLVENEKLYEYLQLEGKHIDKIFKRIISPKVDNANHLNSLKLLVSLLPIHLRENETFLTSFLDNLSSLFLLLDRSTSNKKIDFLLLDLLDFFTLLIKSDHRPSYEKINENNLFTKCLELFFNFPNHSILHYNILNLITETTQSTYLNFYEETTFTNDFFIKLISFVTDENDKQPGLRKANYAHSLEISNLLDSRSNSPYLNTDEWCQFKLNILQRELHLQQSFLCGFIPDKNQKIDQALLSKFEKEFKK